MATRSNRRSSGDTRARILDATESLFIEHGYEAMSLRQITSQAEVNLAAVNYHFGSKEALMREMLACRLDTLNQQRLALLERFNSQLGTHLTCEHVLGAMFIPALRLSRDPQRGGKAFLRLLGRVYSDPSSFIRRFLAEHYTAVAERFFTSFQRTLPHLPREELGWRLHFSIGALSGVLAEASPDELMSKFAHGLPTTDLQLVARLASLMVASLEAPLPDSNRIASLLELLSHADDDLSDTLCVKPTSTIRPATQVIARHRVKPVCNFAEQLAVRAMDPVRHSAHRHATAASIRGRF
ncbi:TetR/AcrR family transcriptional regulator [Paraburkholderia bonniea]|uniref:TetR/AcrR family transcriptional regulator n=1 Tax=Paraburkholderia bonniea TaxID=2152891 RepID=UPI0012913F5C|nr:TetR/AcrR family transcriptional regulator [Paraburkholderia bonniea]WJF88913.1 TetR/AcrR family transcriptional regulator [Paraburkholderia bonniea]WJF92229.1 TetR/AcrR family transcriptional regulator [Paraburkholderia bonniea]